MKRGDHISRFKPLWKIQLVLDKDPSAADVLVLDFGLLNRDLLFQYLDCLQQGTVSQEEYGKSFVELGLTVE